MYKNLMGSHAVLSFFARRRTIQSLGLAVTSASLLVPGIKVFAQHASATPLKPLKVAFVYVTPVSEVGWTAQHDQGRLQMEAALGAQVQTRIVENVAEGPDSERVIRDLASQGYGLIFTTSFGYMDPTIKVAKEFPQVAFEHATGYKHAANVSTYNARFYEGRYLAGMVAGKMSRSALAGYVAAFPIPEVLQGINAFTLGMRAVNPKAQTKVIWTSTWFDPGKEREAALTLINQGADVITHHTSSTAAVQAAEEKKVFSVGYTSDMSRFAPKGQLAAVTHHWGEYYTRIAKAVIAGTWKPIVPGVWGGIAEGFVKLSAVHQSVPKDFIAAVLLREKEIASGRFHPFSATTQKLTDNQGNVVLSAGAMTDQQLSGMNYFVAGVLGTVPKH